MAPTFETTRFQIRKEIGKGGMGVVYAALDRERNLEVALKVIREAGSEALHYFKQEFRSIADIVHPNLICLHELFAEGNQWFFTMELIEGEQFLQYVRGKASPAADTPHATTMLDPAFSATATGELADVIARPMAARRALFEAAQSQATTNLEAPRLVARKELGCDVKRLRHVLQQVAQGLVAVHSRGKLHRDIKSANVMVTAEGRAVILDFGLASTIEDLNRIRARGLVGTLAYASPEQTVGEQLTPASDWYSVGVMMFEALTGYSPFGGDTESLLEKKLTTPPPSPDHLVVGIPPDLGALCNDLLSIDPRLRPTGKEVLERLQVSTAATYFVGNTPLAADFIGREPELALLNSALATARAGTVAVALVHGRSGFGKSSLVQKFIDGLSPKDTLLLRGRCYEQESVPYKGVDSAIDTLAEQLDQWEEIVEEIPVTGLKALVQVFPVLLQSKTVKQLFPQGEVILDAQRRRRAAFQSLRDIIRALQRHQQIVFCIDDMQWCDAESVQLLSSLLAAPDAPSVLYLSSYRSEYEGTNSWLQQWLELVETSGAKLFPVSVGPFSPEESERLATRILGSTAGVNGHSSAKIVGEGEGNPFFIYQLAQRAREQGSKTEALADRITLDSVLRNRFATLPARARDLLEIISVAGRPVAKSDAYAAAGLEHQDPVVLNILRIANLTRSFSSSEGEMVETYHDRIRESVAQSLPREQARLRHEALALQLELAGHADPETLAVHFEGADEAGRAAIYYELAANRAASALAFEKTARFYQKALTLGELSEPDRRATRLKLAEALSNAGRGNAAAEEYEALSQRAAASESLELERRAGFLYCSTGHLEKGLKVYDRIIARLNLREPRSRSLLVVYIVLRLLRLRLRGLHYQRRTADQVPKELLTRIDTTWSLSAGLVLIDIPRSMNFGLMNLSAALRAGEPERLLNAIVMTCWIPVMTGIGGRPLATRLLAIGEELSTVIGTTKARALLEQSRAVVAHGSAEWNNAVRHLAEAEQLYRNHCTGVSWEIAAVNTIHLYSLFTLGDLTQMWQRSEATIKDAAETGDIYSFTVAETFPAAVGQLAMDNPREARLYVQNGLARWSTQGYDVQNAMAALATGMIEIYEGRAAELLPYMEKEWQLMSEYGFAQHPAIRPPFLSFWVDAAVAKAESPTTSAAEKKKLLRLAEQKTRMLRKTPGPYAAAQQLAAIAQVAEARGNKKAALDALLEAEMRYTSLDMKAYAAAVHRRRGSMIGGVESGSMIQLADEQLRSCGAVNPARMAATLVGGWQAE